MPDPIFTNPDLAEIYDHFDGPRDDLKFYIDQVAQIDAQTILDVGCGTGTLACLLAEKNLEVIGLDPALASLKIAQQKKNSEKVQWIHGYQKTYLITTSKLT